MLQFNVQAFPMDTAKVEKECFWTSEWNELFEPLVDLECLRNRFLQGRGAGSRFRSLCWRILLGTLSIDKNNWIEEIGQNRRYYSEQKKKMCLDPRSVDELPNGTNQSADNPLSLDSESYWNQYFFDGDLKACIKQDVDRTFPEMEYFQSTDIRQTMCDILFVFAKENPQLLYKQGMHEILGPLLFVLYSDQQAFSHTDEHTALDGISKTSQNILYTLFNPLYLEHDAYILFVKLMKIVEPWYCEEAPETPDKREPILLPYSRVQDQDGPTSILIVKLNWIHDVLLREIDPQLSQHLDALSIAPQIYGIRWLRLLFGREFPLQDLLLLWDVLIADGAPYLLVDFVFISMLISIRHLLLKSDFTGALHYLMRYPPVMDIYSFLQLALYLLNPSIFPKPSSQTNLNFHHITISGRPHPNFSKSNVRRSAKSPTLISNRTKKFPLSFGKTGAKMIDSINRVGYKVIDNLRDNSGQNSPSKCPPNKESKNLVGKIKFSSARNSPVLTEKIVHNISAERASLMREQLSCLQNRLTDLERSNKEAAEKLEALIELCETRYSQGLHGVNNGDGIDLHDLFSEMLIICAWLRGERTIEDVPLKESINNGPVEIGKDLARHMSGSGDHSKSKRSSQPTPSYEPLDNEELMFKSLGKNNEMKSMKRAS